MPITIGAKRESDFTDPIGMLGDCHRRIERFLQVLASVARQPNGGPLDDEQRAALTTSLHYFRDAAPKHTADEEDSLFPRLRQITNAEAMALLARIEALEQEHEYASKVHDEVDQLGQRWLDQRTLSPDETSRLLAVLEQLVVLYRRHIEIEDTEIFPVAARVLSLADRRSVGAEMARRRGIAQSGSRLRL